MAMPAGSRDPAARLGVLNAQCYAMFRPTLARICGVRRSTAIRIPRRIVIGDSGFVDLVRCKRHVIFCQVPSQLVRRMYVGTFLVLFSGPLRGLSVLEGEFAIPRIVPVGRWVLVAVAVMCY